LTVNRFRLLFSAGLLLAVAVRLVPAGAAPAMSTPQREFRGVWVATVDNIDWPSKPGLPVEQQKSELVAIMDRAAQLKLNAVIFQVRPACDALYESKLEPWSEFLNGKMGQTPDPPYDPLAFAVEEAHKRALELHAWFNPYRAHHPAEKGEISPDHISRTHPEIVRQYGKHLWLDPAEPAVREHSIAVVRDVVHRYDVDGVHIDDYFYPYKEKGPNGAILPFPDDGPWQKYQASGGTLSRDDWRRSQVDRFVEELYHAVKAEKPWVKVGISPFGIWRPGNPPQIKGFDSYQEIYGDSRKWIRNGWVDYLTPQLYWRIDQTAQSYPVLLKWWAEQNVRHRHIWPGNYTGRVSDGSGGWSVSEILNQIRATREQPGATGNVHFSMKVFSADRAGLDEALTAGPYAQPALVPASPWLGGKTPGRPKLREEPDPAGGHRLAWSLPGKDPAWQWVLRLRVGDQWKIEILPGTDTTHALPSGTTEAAISAVNRFGAEGAVEECRLQK
jgi:uncharacterized lipoprotein YddW (UPF0748 family)